MIVLEPNLGKSLLNDVRLISCLEKPLLSFKWSSKSIMQNKCIYRVQSTQKEQTRDK